MPLLVCGTPIGNLDDVTARVLSALAGADVVLCEDTRHTRILLHRHGIEPPRLVSVHRHNEAKRIAEVMALLEAGQRVALVSDAGMPGVADPGVRVVRESLAAGHRVEVLPGPSAVTAALVASGLGGDDGFRFLGWLPRREPERTRLWRELSLAREPVVAFDSPRRLAGSLESLATADPRRVVAVCRELTKRFEEVVVAPASDLADRFRTAPKGEISLVISAVVGTDDAAAAAAGLDSATAAVAELVAAGTPSRVAAGVVSRLTGVPRNALYRPSGRTSAPSRKVPPGSV